MEAPAVRLRIERIALGQTSREVTFTPGLNVVVGDSTTGKTALMRLLRVLLGAGYDGIIPELRGVPHLSGQLMVADEQVAIVRRLVQSEDAPVDVAASDFAARLPARTADRPDRLTYAAWLMRKLNLPELRVPTAPSRPAESPTTPVSIADYLRYCRLTQDQIGVDILGSSNFFHDYKRRVVFRIYFGSYDARIAELQDKLRSVDAELRALRGGTGAFDRFLEGSVLANRAQIEAEHEAAKERLAQARRDRSGLASQPRPPEAEEVGAEVRALDRRHANLRGHVESEEVAVTQLEELGKQLRAQSARLTRAVVAGGHLIDYEFRICPRCGQGVDSSRTDGSHCYLCLQEPAKQPTREDLVVEQTRIEAQIDETDHLIENHRVAAAEIRETLATVARARAEAGARLDRITSGFISDRSQEIARAAADEARAEAEVRQFEEYLALLNKADAARAQAGHLQAQRARIEGELERAERLDTEAQRRIEHLEDRFAELVEELELPRFIQDAEPRSAIDPGSFEPIVNGRRIEQHSGGMRVLVSVAYMLAIHRTTLDLDLRIPRLLMIDGITQNLGRGEYDTLRYQRIWQRLADFHEAYAPDLQMIVAANDVPDFIDEMEVIRLRLSETDRLVPLAELHAAGAGDGGGDGSRPDSRYAGQDEPAPGE